MNHAIKIAEGYKILDNAMTGTNEMNTIRLKCKRIEALYIAI
jgi:hypothetical protein